EYLEKKYGSRLPTYRAYETQFPLILITPASDERITSTFGGLKAGDVVLPLGITDEIRPGVICSLKGAWMKTSDNGQTVSALAPGHHADICGGACYNDCRVEVAAL